MMSFDKASRTASSYKKLYQVTDSRLTYPGLAVLLAGRERARLRRRQLQGLLGQAPWGWGLMGRHHRSRRQERPLHLLDLASGTASLLANAVGFRLRGRTHNRRTRRTCRTARPTSCITTFYPTVSPLRPREATSGSSSTRTATAACTQTNGLAAAALGHRGRHLCLTGKYTDRREPPGVLRDGRKTFRNRQSPRLHRARSLHVAEGQQVFRTGEDCCGGYCTNRIVRPAARLLEHRRCLQRGAEDAATRKPPVHHWLLHPGHQVTGDSPIRRH